MHAGPATGAVPGMHGATLGPAPGGWVPATPAAAVAAESHEPEAQPYDMLSFPAGLIPKLVKSSLKCAPPLPWACRRCECACSVHLSSAGRHSQPTEHRSGT